MLHHPSVYKVLVMNASAYYKYDLVIIVLKHPHTDTRTLARGRFTHTHLDTHTHAHTHTRTHTHTRAYMHKYHIHTHSHIHSLIHTHTHTHAHTQHKHTHTHIRTRARACTHQKTRALSLFCRINSLLLFLDLFVEHNKTEPVRCYLILFNIHTTVAAIRSPLRLIALLSGKQCFPAEFIWTLKNDRFWKR